MPESTLMEMALSADAPPIERLKAIMQILRSDGGCPWDREQTLGTLKPFLIEEAYEVIDAIDSGDRTDLEEELGDLLLQVVFQSQICAEEGGFQFDDVARHIAEKLIRRHPHVFADTHVETSDDVLKNWDAIKRDEKGEGPRSILDGVPRQLPALIRAQQIQSRAARQGFDWDQVDQAFEKVDEELGELRAAMASANPENIKEELGDAFFSLVNVSRFMGHSAEEALTDTIHKFIQRFRVIEQQVAEEGKELQDCTLEELDAIWEDAKLR